MKKKNLLTCEEERRNNNINNNRQMIYQQELTKYQHFYELKHYKIHRVLSSTPARFILPNPNFKKPSFLGLSPTPLWSMSFLSKPPLLSVQIQSSIVWYPMRNSSDNFANAQHFSSFFRQFCNCYLLLWLLSHVYDHGHPNLFLDQLISCFSSIFLVVFVNIDYIFSILKMAGI